MSSTEHLNNSNGSLKPSNVGETLRSYPLINPSQLPGVLAEVVEISPPLDVSAVVSTIGSSSDLCEGVDIQARLTCESSDGEGTDVEIEHLMGGEQKLNSPVSPTGDVQYAGTCRGKRTAISLVQKAVLEEFYRSGMNSASVQQIKLQSAAAEKTGLDIGVIKNWIRNRRRPGSLKTAERIANIMAASRLSQVTSMPPITLNPAAVSSSASPTLTVYATLPSVHSVPTPLSVPVPTSDNTLPAPPAKRPANDRGGVSGLSTQPTVQTTTFHHVHTLHNTAPAHPLTGTPLLVKVRISEDSNEDFVEVEVPSLTFQSLFSAICEELELAPSSVAKIRKLPNVLVRKDRDVQRLKEGQELEVIVNPAQLNPTSDQRGLLRDHMIPGDNVPHVTVHNLLNGQISTQSGVLKNH